VSMGGRVNSQASADGERGPPSARTESGKVFSTLNLSKSDNYNHPVSMGLVSVLTTRRCRLN
jgi:hypothetical protein